MMWAIYRWTYVLIVFSVHVVHISGQDCPGGRYGTDCSLACNCADLSSCNPVTGDCSPAGCVLGWTGTNCATACPTADRYGINCDQTCTIGDESCPVCKAGFNKTADNACKRCAEGTFGVNCTGECHCVGLCYTVTGVCIDNMCQSGWEGPNCQIRTTQTGCIDGRYGNPCRPCNCFDTTEVCDKTTGACTRCAVGYTGPDCQQACTSGLFGADCGSSCHCSDQSTCNPVTGVCGSGCAAGWSGSSCQTRTTQTGCINGQYGNPCRSCNCFNTTEVCDKTTGACTRCAMWYTGQDCQACISGQFGVDCGSFCHCSDQSTCNPVTGVCGSGCAAGWSGSSCQARTTQTGCINGQYGNPCRSCNCFDTTEVCDKTTGACTQCAVGYTGQDCQACLSGQFGVGCGSFCHCSDQSTCNPVTGVCGSGCAAGWSGSSCQAPCTSGQFGVGCGSFCHCSDQSTCNPVTGVCGSGCAAGWSGSSCQARKTQTACIDGQYGNPCRSCNCFDTTEVCEKTTGACTRCAVGYTGQDCQTCTSGLFDAGCGSSCHCSDQSTCNPVTGACGSGCAAGWSGSNCQASESLTDKTEPPPELAGPVGGAVAGLLVIIIIVVVIVVLYKRRRNHPDTDSESGHESRRIVKADQNITNEGTSNAIYANSGDTSSCTPIVVTIPELIKYVQAKLGDPENLENEFKSIPGGLRLKTDIATRPENISKCRYKGMLPYDHSRVVLEPRDSDPSDFINASYINGYVKQREYIASQGPMNKVPGETDFWKMIWQQNSDIVVTLTRLQEASRMKFQQYWPTEGTEVFGHISVELLATHEFDDFSVRTLQARADGKVRTLKQFHFKEWGDHDAPSDTTGVILLREKIHEAKDESKGPIIVHCSAGVGRTGTFIALDILLKKAEVEGQVDIRQCVNDIRKQRANMVQTKAQYAFLHKALCDAWFCGGSTLTPVEFNENYETIIRSLGNRGKSRVQQEFETLEKLKRKQDKTDYSVAFDSLNVTKNRDTDALPPDSERLFLATVVPERTDYINAVYLPGYKNKSAYISTQLPIKDTVIDFWRLVCEQRSTTIIMLNDSDNLTKASGVYWPADDESLDLGPFEVRHQGNIQGGETFQRQFGLHYKKNAREPVRTVRQFCVKGWADGQNVPSSVNLVTLFKSVQEWQRQHGDRPVIVHCMNGVDKTALLCTAWAILEKLRSEQVISIMLTVKQMRNKRPNAVRNLEQYRFLYELAKSYLDDFDTYANFQ